MVVSDIWDRIRSYLSAVFHAPELGHTECLLAFESLTSMSMMSDASGLSMSMQLSDDFTHFTWLGGANPSIQGSTLASSMLIPPPPKAHYESSDLSHN